VGGELFCDAEKRVHTFPVLRHTGGTAADGVRMDGRLLQHAARTGPARLHVPAGIRREAPSREAGGLKFLDYSTALAMTGVKDKRLCRFVRWRSKILDPAHCRPYETIKNF